MKKTLTLLYTCLTIAAYSQTTDQKVTALQTSVKALQTDMVTAKGFNTKQETAIAKLQSGSWLDPKYFTVVKGAVTDSVGIKLDAIAADIKIPVQVDLKPVMELILALQQSVASLQADNTALKQHRDSADAVVTTLEANYQSLNKRQLVIEDSFIILKAAFKTVVDTSTVVKKRVDATNTLVYSELKKFAARITVLEGKVVINDYVPVNLWADKPKEQ